jgi:hypothetical protein
MKTRKSYPHQSLIAEVMQQLHFFKPNPKVGEGWGGVRGKCEEPRVMGRGLHLWIRAATRVTMKAH